MSNPLVALALLAIVLPAPATAQDPPDFQPPSRSPNLPPAEPKEAVLIPSPPARGSRLLGANIVDGSGKKLGEIVDLLLAGPEDIVAVVLRDRGGYLCVPLAVLQPRLVQRSEERDRLPPTALVQRFLFLGAEQDFAEGEALGSLDEIDAGSIQRAHERFGGSPMPAAEAPAADAGGAQAGDEGYTGEPNELPRNAGNTGSGTGSGAGNSSGNTFGPVGGTLTIDDLGRVASAKNPLRLRKLLGRDVKDPKDERLGDVKDIAVDLQRSQVAYVVVSTGGVTDSGLHGVSLDAFQMTEDGQGLRLLTLNTAEPGPTGLDLDHLPLQPALLSGSPRDANPGS